MILFALLIGCQNKNPLSLENKNINNKAQIDSISENVEVEIHARVDTSKNKIKEIAILWIEYLNSNPDIVSDNKFWNTEEKRLYNDFDFSRQLLYQFPSEQLLKYYKPKILSLEKEGENYAIRTIFSAEDQEPQYSKSNPWCITKLYAVKEENEWKLKNALPIITEDWNKEKVGKINFIFPASHKFDRVLANKANDFCNQITKEFNFQEWEQFDFYITQNGDDLGKLLNFDFFFAGYTTGIGMYENRILLSGIGSEFYPHEFIHLILPKFDRHPLIEEGFATWKGGQGGKSFEESAERLANELTQNSEVKFLDVLEKKWGWQNAAFYTSGAILCQAAYNKGGVDLVNSLLQIENNEDQLIEHICKLLEIREEDFDDFWREEVLKFTSI